MRAQKKSTQLSTENWIVKSNTLNEIKNNNMTISQIRLFSIYLSKINPMDVTSREVTFKLDEYARIMQFKRFNVTKLKKSSIDLTRLTVSYCLDDDKGGFETTSSIIFNRLKYYKNDDGEWVVTIDCDDKVLPLMFELKKYYFKYKLWNALQLASPNQLRMYELLKQYEYAGVREISVKDLREFLGLNDNEYPLWANFRRRILDASQIALKQYTDIKFTWEIGQRGKAGKILTLKFNIEKNDGYARQLVLDDFLAGQEDPVIEDMQAFEITTESEWDNRETDDIYGFLADACEKEFSVLEITLLHDYIVKIVPYGDRNRSLELYDYLKRKYDEMNYRAVKTNVKNRFGYLKKIIETDMKNESGR